MVIGTESPSDAWALLKSMVDSLDSATAKKFSQLAVIVGESARMYMARVEGLATAVRYHDAVVD